MTLPAGELLAHRQALLLKRRCPRCAESAAGGAVLRGEDCAFCGAPLVLGAREGHAEALADAMRARWQRWRLLVYGFVTLTSLGAGTLPLGGTLLSLLAMLLGHLVLLRRPLYWLSPARRLLTRLAMKLFFALLGVASLVGNLVALPLMMAAGAGALFSAMTSLGVFACYLEGGLWMLERQIARESRGGRLAPWEWFLPLGLTAGLVLTSLTGVLVSWAMLTNLAALEVPGVADLARWLLEVR